MRTPFHVLLILMLALVACGGGEASTSDEQASEPTGASTSTSPAATAAESEDPTTSTTESGDSLDDGDARAVEDFGDLPAECVEIVAEYLRDLEPLVAGQDIESLFTSEDFDHEEMARLGAAFGEQMEVLQCPEIEGEAAFGQFIELARREAPGTVPYLEFIAEQAALEGTEQP